MLNVWGNNLKTRRLAMLLATVVLCAVARLVWAAPANDLFVRAQVVSGLEGRVSGTTVGATFEGSEPYSLFIQRSSVWYRWSAPFTGRARFAVDGSPSSLTLAVYTGTGVSSLRRVPYREQIAPAAESFDAIAGTTYYVQVATDADETAAFSLSWVQRPQPSNDNFARALPLLGSNGTVQGALLGATREAGETNLGFGAVTVWYRYIPTASGLARFAASGESSTVAPSVYTGTAISNLVQVNRNTGEAFEVVAGRIYWVRIAGFEQRNGSFQLTYSGPGATTFSISGRISNPTSPSGGNGVFNARVTVGSQIVTTDGAGFFNLTGLRVGSYSVSATAPGFTLTPLFRNPVVLSTNATDINFRASVAVAPTPVPTPPSGTFTVSGRITDASGRALAGVTVTRSGNVRTTTNALGVYQFTTLSVGSYILVPTKAGLDFNPTYSAVTVRRASVPNINFYGVAQVAPRDVSWIMPNNSQLHLQRSRS